MESASQSGRQATPQASRPLEGIRVLDLSHALSGPTCTNMLAMLGAEVVKVERPGVGDDFRHYTEHAGLPGMSLPFASANMGKKSITLDLKNPAAIAVVHALVERSDVLVENFRPGVAAKIGLSPGDLQARNPRLVYASISGFGQTGTLRDWTAYDHIVQAMSGIMWMNGNPDDEPMKVGFPIIDTFSGYMAVIGILAALQRRERTGTGDFVDVAMLDSAFNLLGAAVPTYFYTGEVRGRTGNKGYRLVATAETYRTANGYISIGANHQHQIEALCDVLHCRWLIADPRFATHADRVANHEALRTALAAIFREHNGEDIEEQLAARHVPVAIVRNLGQVLKHPHFEERRIFLEGELPGSEQPLKVVGPGFQLASGPMSAGAVPTLGQHTDEVLASLGLGDDAIAALHASGAT
ncbi:Crotonobetainyl-CoA:carnitine CoA-transferase CaiB [Sphingomonas guangdongensis]|uniref:Crotonobetainyl-CoA:carnitine CoA-transferase CaiB n=1 Tax=Sphingomonas guangdongensis TaxID=1141890 RepID=A0A285QCC8_9SPHN|nr:CoA transferase [Sphingomonas guangdongensis]SOB79486.1 Crotonobetainyl-CoA:carnitine CoA-transferase CaiB [Sphingomonas guangdongensis]